MHFKRVKFSITFLLLLIIAQLTSFPAIAANPFLDAKNDLLLEQSGKTEDSREIKSDTKVFLSKSVSNSSSAESKPCSLAVFADLHIKDSNFKMVRKAIRQANAVKGLIGAAICGDLCSKLGTKKELALVVEACKTFSVPIFAVNGNHDYIYRDYFVDGDKKVRGTPAQKKEKLKNFREGLKLKSSRYSIKAGGHLLVFLPTDALKGAPLAQFSEKTLEFLQKTLAKNPKFPTIIFAHAPLDGSYNKKGRMPVIHAAAQPSDKISRILKKNPQVFLWVAGHLHISPSSPDNVSPRNKVGTVTVIHVPAVTPNSGWFKVFKLSPEAAVVKTFNVTKNKFYKKYERTFKHKVVKSSDETVVSENNDNQSSSAQESQEDEKEEGIDSVDTGDNDQSAGNEEIDEVEEPSEENPADLSDTDDSDDNQASQTEEVSERNKLVESIIELIKNTLAKIRNIWSAFIKILRS